MGQHLHADADFLDREVSGFSQNQHSGRETRAAERNYIDRFYFGAINARHAAQMLLLREAAGRDSDRVWFNL